MTDAESMATALGHSPLFACGGHGHARLTHAEGEGGKPAILLPSSVRMIKPRTQAVAPVLLSPLGGGGYCGRHHSGRLSKLISGEEKWGEGWGGLRVKLKDCILYSDAEATTGVSSPHSSAVRDLRPRREGAGEATGPRTITLARTAYILSVCHCVCFPTVCRKD